MSSTNKSTNVLKLVYSLLVRPRTRIDMMELLGISEATFFNYLQTIRNSGMDIDQNDGVYSITSQHLIKGVAVNQFQLTTREKLLVKEGLELITCTDEERTILRKKVIAGADDLFFMDEFLPKDDAQKAKLLKEAITNKKRVVLVNYLSSNSNSCRSRTVEPFKFSQDYTMLWAFDTESMAVKTFKIARIGSVAVMPDEMQFRNRHIELPTDIFRVVGRLDKPIEIKLNTRGYNLLVEEYPKAKLFITRLTENSYMLKTEVASYEGAGRFVLGLAGDVEVVGSDEFIAFLHKKIINAAQCINTLRNLE